MVSRAFSNQHMSVVFHSDRVFSIEAFLTADECSKIIQLAETSGFTSAGVRTPEGQKEIPAIRNNQRAVLFDDALVRLLWQRLSSVNLPSIDGVLPVCLPNTLRFYKYVSGQRFKMHKDGPWLENGFASKLTFLVYLNEEFIGGETDFRDFKISPKTGHALLFLHDTWHQGLPVTGGIKYVLRSDVLYADETL